MILKEWFPDKQHQHHLEIYCKCRFSDPTPDLRNQTLSGARPAICFRKFSRWFWCMIKFENHCSLYYRSWHCELLLKYYSPTVICIKGTLNARILLLFLVWTIWTILIIHYSRTPTYAYSRIDYEDNLSLYFKKYLNKRVNDAIDSIPFIVYLCWQEVTTAWGLWVLTFSYFFFLLFALFLFQFLKLERRMDLRVEDKSVLGSSLGKIETFIVLLVERIIRILVVFPFWYIHNGLIPYP